jgi:hypothetical protein
MVRPRAGGSRFMLSGQHGNQEIGNLFRDGAGLFSRATRRDSVCIAARKTTAVPTQISKCRLLRNTTARRNWSRRGMFYFTVETSHTEKTMKKIVAALALSAAIITPALAAEYYIVQDTATKKCTVVDKKPTVTTTTVVGDGTVYTTREEASTAVKTVKICQNM